MWVDFPLFLYICTRYCNEMDTQDSNEKSAKTIGKGTLFLIATIIGLLLGAVVTMLVIDLTGYHHPTVVNVIPSDTLASKHGSDTVVKYVIHKYEDREIQNLAAQDLDSIPADSLLDDLATEDLTMEYDELYMSDLQESGKSVMEDRMLSKVSSRVIYLDQNKQEIAVPEQKPSFVQIQQWTTPIKNKMSYNFSGNVLKIKGLSLDDVKLYNIRNQWLIVSNGRVYPIHPNNQFDKLVESAEYDFLF